MEQNRLGSKRCRVCSSSDLELVYQAPVMPLGGQLIEREDEFKPELFYPLHYVLCRNCSTFQSIELIPDNLLISENTCVSATAETIFKRDYEVYLETQRLYGTSNFVVEVGGSTGGFLKNFQDNNIRVLNIEPVPEVARVAIENGIDTRIDFLNESLAVNVVASYPGSTGQADLVVAKHVLELVPDLHQFIESCSIMMSYNGRIMMEVPYIKYEVEGDFYSLNAHLRVYHFSLTSLERLFSMHELRIERVIPFDDLGEGLRLYVGKKAKVEVSDSVEAMLAQEKEIGLDKPEFYINGFKKGIKLKADLVKIIERIKDIEHGSIVGFGAGIKASILLNYCGLDGRYIDYLVDNGKHKQGKLMPSVRLPIYSPERIDESVDYVLLLAWVYEKEIIELLKPFTDNGGKIIIPTPEVRIYGES